MPLKRSKPLKRTPFKPREGPANTREPKPRARAAAAGQLAALARSPASTYAGGTSGVALPKAKPVRSGKRAPTKDESAWMAAIVAHGCIACRLDGRQPRPTAVHHIVSGGRRLGHKYTLPLCDPGHHQGGEAIGLVSRHPFKARFEARYGAELDLLHDLQGILKLQPDGSYAP